MGFVRAISGAAACAAAVLASVPSAAYGLTADYYATITVDATSILAEFADATQRPTQTFTFVGPNIAAAGILFGDLARKPAPDEAFALTIGVYTYTSQGSRTSPLIVLADTPVLYGTTQTKDIVGEWMNAWVDVPFLSVAELKSGASYALKFDLISSMRSDTLDYIFFAGAADNPYAQGAAYGANGNGVLVPLVGGTGDFIFKTYALAAPVPEPSTHLLILAGLASLGAMMRRRTLSAA